MMSGFDGGVMWIWGAAMMVLFWGAVIALVVWAVRGFSGPRHDSDSALETLRRRFAAGEISQEEFDKTRRAFQS